MPDPITDVDRRLLNRAVELAMNGRGSVEPNPMAGCVVTSNAGVLGEGFHEYFGGPHAEPNALAACTQSPQGATVYVTLEPCCHTSKKTPPCVAALVAAKVARVVVGCIDPNPRVSGRGIAQLRESGIQVDVADDAACRQLLAPFIATTVLHRPYVTLKWAQSADGKVGGPGRSRVRISNETSYRIIHELRSRCDAILVGIGTVLADDPLLSARGTPTRRTLLRVVLDSHLRLPIGCQLVRTIDRAPVVVFCSKEAADFSGTRVALAASGVQIHPVPSDAPGILNLERILQQLAKMGVTHLLVEPGPTLAHNFLTGGLWDRAWVIRSPIQIADAAAPAAAETPPCPVATIDLAGDILTEYLNPRGAYGGAFASADFRQISVPARL